MLRYLGNPNPAISTGIWLQNEKVLANHIEYGIPDINTKENCSYWWWPFGY
ncbi:hypothetical protein [Enterococcus faecalis]|uniref:hypothetical protein n=1 Tax=Enterococcus faecalis TaxID=1351 RepID=UPI002FDBDBC3